MSNFAEQDIYDSGKQPTPFIEIGTIGWEGDSTHYDMGTADNDGYTLVKVTLYRGRTPGTPPKKGVAQGYPIMCQIADGLFRIPKPGTRCYVAIPAGFDGSAGAAVVIATVSPSPTSQFSKDRVVVDFGDDIHVVFRGKSIAMQDPDNRFLSVGTPISGGAPGLTFQAADGSGGVIQEGVVSWFVADGGDAQTIIQMTPSKVQCLKKSGGYWSVDADGFMGFGTSCSLKGSAIYLGNAPTALNPAACGPPIGPSPTYSSCVFVSLV